MVFEKLEVQKVDGGPYTVFTPYKNKWIQQLSAINLQQSPLSYTQNFYKEEFILISLKDLGFVQSSIKVPSYNLKIVNEYQNQRDFPSMNGTSHLGTHLRFGTVSIREILFPLDSNSTFVSELIWREYYWIDGSFD